MKFYLLLLHLFTLAFTFKLHERIIPETPANVQTEAVLNLIKRTVGDDDAQRFVVAVDKTLPFRSFQVKTINDENESRKNIFIRGWDGVSVAKGFHHFIKYYLQQDITWTNTSLSLLVLDDISDIFINSTSASPIIYYQNVCTWSYSFVWWDWSTWRRHIDWMAMMGITLTIAPIQEHIWYDVYLDLGLTQSEIDEHFAGPAFQAWQRMGNIRGWYGPLPPTSRRAQLLLQQKILQAQRELGMSVALPAFAGHVPLAMQRLYPNVTLTQVERWNNFPDQYCCPLFVDPNEMLFTEIAGRFLRSIIATYGTNHIYFSDPFNEIQPRRADVSYLNATAYHIYESMRTVDESAIWLLQGWMFVKNIFWTDELIQSFLTAVPIGRMLVLDLQSEQFPQYERTHSFHGQPFVWCMLHNFGGTLGMHGSVDAVNTGIRLARQMKNSSMIGVGITPEGIHQNYILYSLVLERAWQLDDFDLQRWFDYYARVRYGVDNEHLQQVWQLLRHSVYSYHGLKRLHGKYTITRRPSLNLNPWTWYNISSVYQAWSHLLDSNSTISTRNYANYEYDLVDVTRQFLQAMSDRLYINLMAAYKQRSLLEFSSIGEKLFLIFDHLESILATNKHFLLGPWLESAKAMARTEAEQRLFEMNARNQITSWGPHGQILDYACKQWSGLIRDYYRPRWSLFLQMLQQSIKNGTKFDRQKFKDIVSNEIEDPFTIRTTTYPVNPIGSTYEMATNIYYNWTASLGFAQFLHEIRLIVRHI